MYNITAALSQHLAVTCSLSLYDSDTQPFPQRTCRCCTLRNFVHDQIEIQIMRVVAIVGINLKARGLGAHAKPIRCLMGAFQEAFGQQVLV